MATTTMTSSGFGQQTASGYATPTFQYPKSQAKNISPNSVSPTSPYTSGSTNMTTPPQTSPTTPNPYLPLAPRQLHPPKCPMYRPAALRTTERATLITAKLDSLAQSVEDVKSPVKPSRPVESIQTQSVEPVVGSTEEVTGPPSKSNWKPDAESNVCDAPTCNKTFTLFDRRHHCRRCGNIFCATHTQHVLKLDQHCRYNAKGLESRVCSGCFDEYQRLCAKSRSSSTSSSSTTMSRPTATPTAAKMTMGDGKNEGTLRGRLNSYVGSYRDNWSWSTF